MDRRALNRATLDRQLLLRRSGSGVPAALAHLVGLQALMRSTIHVIGAGDAAAIRPLVQPALDRDLFANLTHGRWMRGPDTAAVAAHAHALLAERPMTPGELGAALLRRWPDSDAPRPDPDTPAPARFLYDFDNLLLSHRDRSRVLTGEYRDRAVTRHGPVPRPVLVDGFTAGAWTAGAGVLTVRVFVPLSPPTPTPSPPRAPHCCGSCTRTRRRTSGSFRS